VIQGDNVLIEAKAEGGSDRIRRSARVRTS
jgi:hypothetical protein